MVRAVLMIGKEQLRGAVAGDSSAEVLSAEAAAKRHGLAPCVLRAAARDGRVRSHPGVRQGREVLLMYAHELEEDLARFPCSEEGCDRAALGVSGRCGDHRRATRPTTCPGCGKTRYLRPSEIGTGYCRDCSPSSPQRLASYDAMRARGRVTIVCPGCLASREVWLAAARARLSEYCKGCMLRRRDYQAGRSDREARGVLSMTDAAREFHVGQAKVRALIKRGAISANATGTVLTWEIPRQELAQVLRPCAQPGCPRLDATGRCWPHRAERTEQLRSAKQDAVDALELERVASGLLTTREIAERAGDITTVYYWRNRGVLRPVSRRLGQSLYDEKALSELFRRMAKSERSAWYRDPENMRRWLEARGVEPERAIGAAITLRKKRGHLNQHKSPGRPPRVPVERWNELYEVAKAELVEDAAVPAVHDVSACSGAIAISHASILWRIAELDARSNPRDWDDYRRDPADETPSDDDKMLCESERARAINRLKQHVKPPQRDGI